MKEMKIAWVFLRERGKSNFKAVVIEFYAKAMENYQQFSPHRLLLCSMYAKF